MYLGLIWRFNTKDILHPHRLVVIVQVITGTLQSPPLDLLILAFALILWGLYALFDIWMDGALARVRARLARRKGRPA